jgi:hypothetical protein
VLSKLNYTKASGSTKTVLDFTGSVGILLFDNKSTFQHSPEKWQE